MSPKVSTQTTPELLIISSANTVKMSPEVLFLLITSFLAEYAFFNLLSFSKLSKTGHVFSHFPQLIHKFISITGYIKPYMFSYNFMAFLEQLFI